MTVRSPTPEQIAARAYQIYLERGRVSGHEMDDWLQAEYELMQLPCASSPRLSRRSRYKGTDRDGNPWWIWSARLCISRATHHIVIRVAATIGE